METKNFSEWAVNEVISVSVAKSFRESIDATHIVIFSIDRNGVQHVLTHGETIADAEEAAIAGNKLKAALGWPEHLCDAKPIERYCCNCHYYEVDYGMWCVNGWSGDGSDGFCQLEPKKTKVTIYQKCRHFEPK